MPPPVPPPDPGPNPGPRPDPTPVPLPVPTPPPDPGPVDAPGTMPRVGHPPGSTRPEASGFASSTIDGGRSSSSAGREAAVTLGAGNGRPPTRRVTLPAPTPGARRLGLGS